MTPALRDALMEADLFLRQGDTRSARSLLEQLVAKVKETADQAELRLLLGQAYFQEGDPAAAEREVRRALEVFPTSAPAHGLMGLALVDQDRLDEAAVHLEQALRLNPQHARTCANLGVLQRRRGLLPEARALLGRAIAIDSKYAPAWRGLAETLEREGLEEKAIDAWRTWSGLHPDPGVARSVVGAALARMRRWTDAEAALNEVPDSADLDGSSATRLAFVRKERGDLAGACVAYDLAAKRAPSAINPRIAKALILPQIYADGDSLRQWRAHYTAGLDSLEADLPGRGSGPESLWALDWSNFYLAYQGGDDLPLQRRYASLISMLAHSAGEWDNAPEALPRYNRKLRVGFASSFFRRCTVAAYFGSWITRIDRQRFETFVFHFGSEVDTTTRYLCGAADHAFLVEGGVRAIIARIRAAALDVLIYPQLGMDGRDATLAALRLAPIQCAAWGHPVTSGSACIDFFFSCADMEPPDAAAHYCERILLLPGLGTSYENPGCRPGKRDQFGLPEDAHLYACPQSLFKIHPDNDVMVADLLGRDPRACLVFCAQPDEPATIHFQERVRRTLDARGIDFGRVIWQPLRANSEFRTMLSVCDVMLDTPHWSGGNTSLDALAARLPIVTCPGRFLRGRQTAGMLRLLGLERLIAESPAHAVDLAIVTASERSSDLRKQIAAGEGLLYSRSEGVSALERHLLQITDWDS